MSGAVEWLSIPVTPIVDVDLHARQVLRREQADRVSPESHDEAKAKSLRRLCNKMLQLYWP